MITMSSFLLLFFYVILVFEFQIQSTFANTGGIKCIEKEKQALLMFKRGLHDNGALSTWKDHENEDCCQWKGVQCNNQTGHVIMLRLQCTSELYLTGAINGSLIYLQHLTYLDLSSNYFGGSHIPKSIGFLRSLKYLDLSYAGLDGTIPPQFGMLGNLRHLDLRGNALYGAIPYQLGRLSYLQYLDLSQNHFLNGTIPYQLGMILHLQHLDLSENHLDGIIPYQLRMLSHLQYLDLGINGLNGTIPPQLGRLPHLQHLYLYNNQLDGEIPYQLGNLSQLIDLDLSFNSLVGAIPSHGNLSFLNLLDLGYNDGLKICVESHTDAIEWLSNLSSLSYLDLSGLSTLNHSNHWIQVIGMLPSLTTLIIRSSGLSDANLIFPSHSYLNFSSSLSTLDISRNMFTSSKIFQWIFNYAFNLCELCLHGNYFLNDTIHDGFANMSSLKYLNLSSNNLEGKIPKFIGNLKSLKYLDLSGNNLEGKVPKSIGNLSSLKYLSLNVNNLEGEIPKSIGDICTLQSVIILNNLLSGGLSSFVHNSSRCIASALQTLDLSGNQLSEEIPESIGSLVFLENLYLDENSLKGVVTELLFTNLSKLWNLDLSYNSLVLNFSDKWIPPFQLRSLYVSTCKLGPRFPKWLQNQNDLSDLDISNANITDAVPEWFWGILQNMYFMNISYNNLRGVIPNLPSKLDAFPALIITSNQFEGPVPPFLLKAEALRLSKNRFSDLNLLLCDKNTSQLEYLGVLDVSSNQLAGHMPSCWNHLKYLAFLDLSNNMLSGEIPASLGALANLEALVLRNNRLIGELPSSLENCTNLLMLDVGQNNLSGSIPSWIGKSLQQLAILSVRLNQFNGGLPLSLCYLQQIQVLDLSRNSFSEGIPPCLNNLTSMAQQIMNSSVYSSTSYFVINNSDYRGYDLQLFMMWKGAEFDFKDPDLLLKSIDLSSNHLTGEIPMELGDLLGLVSLNISRNNLSGEITPTTGNLKSLEFLDLSNNNLSGKIPSSLAQIDRLTELDVSNNSLCGMIPIGTQLQSFDTSRYNGNTCLCGKPLDKKCLEEETPMVQVPPALEEDKNDKSGFKEAFSMSMGLGFPVGFWGLLGPILVKQSWRHTYLRFLNKLIDSIYVIVAVNMRSRL